MAVTDTPTCDERDQVRCALEQTTLYAIDCGAIDAQDRRWAYNELLDAMGAEGPAPSTAWEAGTETFDEDSFDLDDALAVLSEVAVANGRFEDSAGGRDRASMAIMGRLTPRPSDIARSFEDLRREKGALDATDWFYRLCCDVGYVRRSAIARNIEWTSPTRWGELEITINLSKPEKDPRDIAAALTRADDAEPYPACQLCMSNEGYAGRAAASPQGAHPARQNLRIVPIELGNETWGLQYSPYAYFNEHCIAMSQEHRPMHVDRENIARLLDFVDTLPHYFVGSNADLPIVGGSILTHDHFQGGRHVFPMMRAQVERTFTMPGFDDVRGEVLQWPMSVLRLSCESRDRVLDAAAHVLEVWRGHADASCGIVPRDPDGTPHNTVTPVAARENGNYTLYLALRCNIATDEHPLGVFHPHADKHHIKKENIGLIEVMGLAILPPRLVDELACVEDTLLAARATNEDEATLLMHLEANDRTAPHAEWATEVARRHPDLTHENAQRILRDEVATVFAGVLEDAGVFKWNDTGRAGLQRFISTL